MAAQEQDSKQVRNVLWCVPRSVSTAVLRAMHNRGSCAGLLEPYNRSYFVGEERISKRFVDLMPALTNFKFSDIRRDFYDAKHEDAKLVFSKDMAFFIVQAVNRGLYKLQDLLPNDYVHTFLIRKPEKAIKSMYQLFASNTVLGWEYWTPEEAGFKELFELYTYVKHNIDPNPLVIDADDLLAKPEAVLRLYCERIGVEFKQCMVSWDPNDGLAEKLEAAGPWAPIWDGCLKVDSFTQNTPVAATRTTTDLPPEVLQCIDQNQEWYAKLLAVATRF